MMALRLRIRAAIVDALHMAALALAHARESRKEIPGDREISAAPDVHAMGGTIRACEIAAVARGLARIHLHRAADRIASSERSLGSAQDLDAIHVEQVEDRARERRVVHVID